MRRSSIVSLAFAIGFVLAGAAAIQDSPKPKAGLRVGDDAPTLSADTLVDAAQWVLDDLNRSG